MAAIEQLIADNLDLAQSAAARHCRDRFLHCYDDFYSYALEGLWRAAVHYDGVRPFRPYAWTCCYKSVFNCKRAYRRQEEKDRQVEALGRHRFPVVETEDRFGRWLRFDAVDGNQPDPAEQVGRDEELAARLADLLRRLPKRARAVLEARFFGGMTLQEVGEVIGVSRERIRQSEARSHSRLRDLTLPPT